jgi:hypothetical protein
LFSGKFPSLQKSKYRRSNSIRNTLLHRAVIPQEEPHFVALSPAGATSPLLLRSLTTTLEQIALQEILLLEAIQG